MAFAMKCDICGSLYEMYECKDKNLRYANGIGFMRSDGRGGCSNRFDYDCCPNCLNEIAKKVEELKNRK